MKARRRNDEQGVALVMAIAFLVLIAVVSAALLTFITSSVNNRSDLDVVRDRQYAADAAIEASIARVRALGGTGPGLTACGGPDSSTSNGIAIRVECANVPTVTTGLYLQRNVLFTACTDTGVACTEETTVVRAQVNFASTSSAEDYQAGDVTRTYVQSWSVNR